LTLPRAALNLAEVERTLVKQILKRSTRYKSEVATLLKLSPSAFRRRLDELKIP
jgi:DNA-binding NtrC family response regulator